MTLLELKARSERALPVLRRHFAAYLYGDVFLAEAGGNYHGLKIACDCPDASKKWGCSRCRHPLAGTPMIGAMSGYYEPEWDEETTYELLREVLWWTVKPDGMSDSDWAGALAIVDMTPASHVERMASLDREMGRLSQAHDVALSQGRCPS